MKKLILCLTSMLSLSVSPMFAADASKPSADKVQPATIKSLTAANEPQQSKSPSNAEEQKLTPINASDYLKEGVGCGLPSFDSNAEK